MREARTKFLLSHIDDVGEGEGAGLCVFTQRIAPTCALHHSAVLSYVVFTQRIAPTCAFHHSAVLTYVIETGSLDKSCKFVQHRGMLEFVRYSRLIPVPDTKYQLIW